jgi:hypothetical protein
MAYFYKDVTIDFEKLDGKGGEAWLAHTGLKPAEIPDLDCTAKIELDLDEFDDDDIEKEYERRFRPDEDAIGTVYRYLAEGDVEGAMELMSREFGLAPPYHEKKIADLLSSARGSIDVQS